MGGIKKKQLTSVDFKIQEGGERKSAQVSVTVYVSVSECEIPRYFRVGFAREAFWEAGEEKDGRVFVSPHAVRE